jgi:hypothetical protein
MVSGILLSEKMNKDYWTEEEYEGYIDDEQ